MRPTIRVFVCLILAVSVIPAAARRAFGEPRSLIDQRFDPAAYEEDGGSGFTVFSGPGDDVHGFGLGHGIWLKNAPVFGDYLIRTYYHGGQRAYYSGVGMTLRLMPRWTLAPHIGGGGNYNYSIARRVDDHQTSGHARGDSYWSGHAETGIRLWIPHRLQYFDVAVRQAWNHGPEDYILFLISFGRGALPRR